MYCNLMVYVKIVLTTLVTITCLIGDNFVDITQHPLLKALVDNATHAVIGALSGIAFVIQFYDRISNCLGWILIFTCFAVSSLIDLDHFIQARSFSLEEATNLIHRPFLHCSTIPMILFVFFVTTSCLNYLKTSFFLGILVCAFFTHHTRDAIRRGYWLCPFGHTDRLPHLSYIFLTILAPYLVFYAHTFCRSSYIQSYFGFHGKHHDLSARTAYRYSIV